MPARIQRKRTKGWRMPEGAVYVGRPTKWGNSADWKRFGRKAAVELYRESLNKWIVPFDLALGELRGKDLACWCPLDQPCHADVLLELANDRG